MSQSTVFLGHIIDKQVLELPHISQFSMSCFSFCWNAGYNFQSFHSKRQYKCGSFLFVCPSIVFYCCLELLRIIRPLNFSVKCRFLHVTTFNCRKLLTHADCLLYLLLYSLGYDLTISTVSISFYFCFLTF